MVQQPTSWRQAKKEIRIQARVNRREQRNRTRLSRQICRKLAALPEYVYAHTVMLYVNMEEEVGTRAFLPRVWKDGKRVVIPYCVGERLELFYLEDYYELVRGTLGILEPRSALRDRADRRADVSQLDLIVVPGVAFDRRGGRLGHGKGYYDRLLRQVRPDAALVALAFECQLFPEIPMLPHDVPMHKVITEEAAYEARALP